MYAAGDHRVKYRELFEAEIRAHNERFRAAADVGPRDVVLDIGCGAGESTRQAARVAASGSVLGVDVSVPILDLARRLTAEEGPGNVAYERADAQVHRFAEGRFDLCVSRFGAMFFADPVAAFGNIRAALRPGARLVLLVWQDYDRNEWAPLITENTAGGPFSFADPVYTEGVLTASGFAEVAFADVHEPVYYGPDSATAREFILGMRKVTGAGPLDRLPAILDEHETGDGVLFDSRAWIITARRP